MSELTEKQAGHLRKIATAEEEEREKYPHFRGFAGRAIARILWPDSPGWNKRSRRHSTPAGGAMGATMPMKGARAAWDLHAKGMLYVESTEYHQNLFRVSRRGSEWLASEL